MFTRNISKVVFQNQYKTCFTLFIRKGKYYTSPDFPTVIEETLNKYFYDVNDKFEIRILGKYKNKGLMEVKEFQPIIQVIGHGLEPIVLESLLLNVTQRELFYTTRLLEFKNVIKKYFPRAKVLEFGLRRAPDIKLAYRISEIAAKLGYLTSNMMLYDKYSEKITGTLPHAFIQYGLFSGEYENEVQLWKYLLENNLTDTILPDTIDTIVLLKKLLPVLDPNKIRGVKIRLDSGDHVELIKEIAKINTLIDVKYILSGDYDIDKVKYVGENLEEEYRNKVIGIAGGTQIVNNTKPLSIVYKLTGIYKNGKWIPVKKLAPGKKQIEGVKYYDYIENKLKPKLSPFPNDTAVY